MSVTEEQVLEALSKVIDPDLGISIVKMGMIRDVKISENEISCNLVLTTPACPVKDNLKKETEDVLKNTFPSYSINVRMSSVVKKAPENASFKVPVSRIINLDSIEKVKNIIAISSCKGGVGKTTNSVNIALALAKEGASVGLLDLDVHGPNVPIMLGVVGQPKIRDSKIQPVEVYGIKMMSIGLIIDNSTPVIWRGPLQATAVKQLFEDVNWGELDYLVLDLPPGTGDIHLTLSQNIPVSGIVTVSTPQLVAVIDTLKGINMFEKMGVPNLGMILNMSYLVCTHCNEKNYLFPKAEIDRYLDGKNIEILGELPMDPEISYSSDKGQPIVIEKPEHYISQIYKEIASKIASKLSIISYKKSEKL